MKALIAIVMFLFGLFVGLLVFPTINEFSVPLYLEEEYSTARAKALLTGFGITLPFEVTELNVFMTQDSNRKKVWVKFECSPDVKDDFVMQLNSRHAGLFNRVIENPKKADGMPVTWWTYNNSFHYYEFKDMCVAYDDVLRNLYLYAIAGEPEPSPTLIQE